MAVTQPLRLTLLAAALASTAALADQYHYKDNLPGERAAGLGGAYIAVSDDPSGIFYNPAGILFSNDNYFSLSANAYNSAKTVYKDTFGKGNDYTYESSGLVPTFLGFTQSYQKLKWGFAVTTIRSDLYDQNDSFSVRTTISDDQYEVRRKFFRQDTLTLAGPAAAYELAPNVVIGLSLLGFQHTEKEIDNQLILKSSDPADGYNVVNRSLNNTAFGIWPKLGIQIMPIPKLSFGATVSKPITLKSDSTWRRFDLQNGDLPSGGNTTNVDNVLDFDEDENGTSDLYSPVFLGMGVAWFPSQRFLLTADFEYASGDSGYDRFKVAPTYNWAIGSEYYVLSNLALRVGLYSNNAITPEVKSGRANQAEHVNQIGGTLGVTLYRPGSSLTLGAGYTRGSGKGQAFSDDTGIQTVNQNALTLYLTGSYQL